MWWEDDAVAVAVGKFSETSAVLTVYAAAHGLARGVVKGGLGPRQRGQLQPGNLLRLRWNARLPEHLGHFTIEPKLAVASLTLNDPAALAATSSICALLHAVSVERDPHPLLYAAAERLLRRLAAGEEGWQGDYVRFELLVLQEGGYRLDLARCAASGVAEELIYVSPKSGRAVSRSAGFPYAPKLLPYPDFLKEVEGTAEPSRILDGMRLTGYFLEHWLLLPNDRRLPAARERLRRSMEKAAGATG